MLIQLAAFVYLFAATCLGSERKFDVKDDIFAFPQVLSNTNSTPDSD